MRETNGRKEKPPAAPRKRSFRTLAILTGLVAAAFVALVEEISAYDDKNPVGALQSESFGSYSYSRDSAGSVPGAAGWQGAFAGRLNDYQRLTSEVMV